MGSEQEQEQEQDYESYLLMYDRLLVCILKEAWRGRRSYLGEN